MSAVLFGYCNIDKINTHDIDSQELINILSFKNYEPIPHYTKKDMQQAYIIALENVAIYSEKIIKDFDFVHYRHCYVQRR